MRKVRIAVFLCVFLFTFGCDSGGYHPPGTDDQNNCRSYRHSESSKISGGIQGGTVEHESETEIEWYPPPEGYPPPPTPGTPTSQPAGQEQPGQDVPVEPEPDEPGVEEYESISGSGSPPPNPGGQGDPIPGYVVRWEHFVNPDETVDYTKPQKFEIEIGRRPFNDYAEGDVLPYSGLQIHFEDPPADGEEVYPGVWVSNLGALHWQVTAWCEGEEIWDFIFYDMNIWSMSSQLIGLIMSDPHPDIEQALLDRGIVWESVSPPGNALFCPYYRVSRSD